MSFKDFKNAVSEQFRKMTDNRQNLYLTEVSKEALWDAYINNFPADTRQEYTCNSCRSFIRAAGNVVGILNNDLVSIWDVEVEAPYQDVADALSALVKSKAIRDSFLSQTPSIGVDFNISLSDIRWEHLFVKVPAHLINASSDSIESVQGVRRTNAQVFARTLNELSTESFEMVLDLIDQNSLYRGAENKAAVENMLTHKRGYENLSDIEKELYCWEVSAQIGGAARFRNTAIGTLLVDLSEGKALDHSVRSFESKVAPMNYKRPTALITQGMITSAEKTVRELGIEDALGRRYAVPSDVTINNVRFADRSIKPAMNIFDEMREAAPTKVNLKKVEEVTIDTFLDTILPNSQSVEVMFENRQVGNLVSLIAPTSPDAKAIFKWDNNFSWSYNGEVADSIKERVKRAGGRVDGVLRASLSWFNYDDLDIHVIEPDGTHINYSMKKNYATGGHLDIDMNVGSNGSREAVENITWPSKATMLEGIYKVYIKNYSPREKIDVGFDVEIEYDGTIHTFHYDREVTSDVTVATFKFSRAKGIEFITSIPSSQASKSVWGVSTGQFQKVTMIMDSPNHWDDKATGNKHVFFIMADCKNPNKSRGFFNEFLKEELNVHRKVFEVLGAKMKTPESETQLSGVGFSSTQRNHILCRVTGSFTRILKINF